MDDNELVRIYWREAGNRVGQLTDLWLSVEEAPTSEAAQELKRLLHTMKGEAHMLGLTECAELVRAMEDAALAARSGMTEGLGDVFLTAVDAIAVMATNDGAGFDGLEEIVAQLEAAATGGAPEASLRRASTAPPPAVGDLDAVTGTQEVGALDAKAEPSLLDPTTLSPLVHEAKRIHLEQTLLRPQLREIRRMLRALMAEIDPSLSLESLHERIVKTLSYGSELERRITDLNAAWSNSEFSLSMALEHIDETVRAAAMVSVGALEAQVHRTARGAAAAVGKRVRVAFSGDAYVDATVERSLGPALLHLVRNAVDHGLEAPELRAERGKPREGTVEVSIQQSESSVHVRVRDDGGGVSLDELRAKIERIDPDRVPTNDQELLQRIFDHGVTTRATATELSGRGVGLDVVAKQVRSLGGTVRVESKPRVGTMFELVLPTRLRADVVVPVTVGGVRLAFAARGVEGVQKIREVVADADGWRLPRGEAGNAELLPLFDLGAIFGAARRPEPGDAVIVVRHRAGAFAARVDGYHNPRALSFERIEELPIHSDLVIGVAPAPDGGVFFLLDADATYDMLRGLGVAPAVGRAKRRGIGGRHVLVVEDAPVARELLLGLLRSFGLEVSDAADGRQGLTRARESPPDLILTDIEMPFLGGLEMIAELNADPALASIPVVVLTTRQDEEVRAQARALGVHAFLSKQRFVERELRQVIDRCLGGDD
ncbi:MAG: response regulator [Sandaracinaceae bacterium]|nr:response regulator [Sandaracinaceae bacterium]